MASPLKELPLGTQKYRIFILEQFGINPNNVTKIEEINVGWDGQEQFLATVGESCYMVDSDVVLSDEKDLNLFLKEYYNLDLIKRIEPAITKDSIKALKSPRYVDRDEGYVIMSDEGVLTRLYFMK